MTPPTPEPVVRYVVSNPVSGTGTTTKAIFDTIYGTLKKYEDGELVATYTHGSAWFALREDGTLTVSYSYTENFKNESIGWYHDAVSAEGTGTWYSRAGTSSSISQVSGGWTGGNNDEAVTYLLTHWDTLVNGLSQDDVRYGRYLAEVES